MKSRKMLVCSTVTQGCLVCQTHVSLEFVLLVPKGQCFDGIVNFPTTVEEHPRNKKSYCDNPPYKRPPINLKEYEICDDRTEQHCLEIVLTEFGKFKTVDLTICKECMEDYDYYTVLEYEYDGSFNAHGNIGIPAKFTPEFKRLLQVDCSDYIKDLEKHVANGEVSAMAHLALAYYYGEGVEKNLEEAAKWWRLAAEKALKTK